MTRLLHYLRLCGCATGDAWHVDGRCVPIVTAARERAQRAIEEHRNNRRVVSAVARRGYVQAAAE